MSDISSKPTNTVEGSINPVESNTYDGAGSVPAVDNCTPLNIELGGENILGSGGGHGGFALGEVPD